MATNIIQIPIRGFDKNFSYFVHDGANRDIAIVDPGDLERLEELIDKQNWRPKAIWLTHSHFDHIQGVEPLVVKYQIPVYLHRNAFDRVDVPKAFMRELVDGDQLKINNLKVDILYTPGHIDDAVCFFISSTEANDNIPKIITGDTLFVEGCGRADFENSNVKDLYNSLQRLKQLPVETEVYAGHNYGSLPVSTIAHEIKENRFMICEEFEKFTKARLG